MNECELVAWNYNINNNNNYKLSMNIVLQVDNSLETAICLQGVFNSYMAKNKTIFRRIKIIQENYIDIYHVNV